MKKDGEMDRRWKDEKRWRDGQEVDRWTGGGQMDRRWTDGQEVER